MAVPQLKPGTRIGPYRIIKPLGWGGMAHVFRAELLRPVARFRVGEHVAIKDLRDHLFSAEGALQRIQREVDAGRMWHPNVVETIAFDALLCDSRLHLIIAMAVPGEGTLDAAIQRSVLDEEAALVVARQVLLGLDALHQRGFVHRDIKPPNILVLLRQGRPVRALIMDFGLAFPISDHTVNDWNHFGTVPYMAPELLSSDRPTPAADLYSLGVTLVEMVCGLALESAFENIDQAEAEISQLAPDCSRAFCTFVAHLTQRTPGDRPSGAVEAGMMADACLYDLRGMQALRVDRLEDADRSFTCAVRRYQKLGCVERLAELYAYRANIASALGARHRSSLLRESAHRCAMRWDDIRRRRPARDGSWLRTALQRALTLKLRRPRADQRLSAG